MSGLSRKISNQIRVGVGVGNLTNLYIGRFVQNGLFTTDYPLPDHRLEQITFEIDASTLDFIDERFIDEIPFDDAGMPVSIRQKNGGVRCPVKLLRGQILSTDRSIANKKRPSSSDPWDLTVMIHELELVRFFYTNSSNLCRAVFSDAFSSDKLHQTVFAEEQFAGYDASNDTHSFVHRMGFSDEDMPCLGRILFEPDEVALKGARRIYQSTRASRITTPRRDMVGYPRTSLPYRQKVRLSLIGHRSRLADLSYVFTAHRISACSAVFPFRHLSFASVRPTGITDENLEPDEKVPFKPKPKTGPAHITDDTQGSIRSDLQPAADSIPVLREVGTRLFTGLSNVSLVRARRTVLVPPRPRRIPAHDPFLADWSTGKPGHGRTTAAKLIQTERNERGVLSADLSTFVSVIEALTKIEPTWSIKTIPVGDSSWQDELSGVWRGFFPLVNCVTRSSMLFKFSFLNDEKTERRQLIGVELEIDDAFIYLLEAQRRIGLGLIHRTGYRDTLPILMLRRADWQSVDENEVAEMLRDTVSNPSKTWPNPIRAFERQSIEHGNGADTPEKLASRIASVVKRNLPN